MKAKITENKKTPDINQGKTIEVSKFVTDYVTSDPNKKEDMMKDLLRTLYLPYQAKILTAQNMVETTAASKDGIGTISSPILYLNYVVATLVMYTKFIVDKENTFAIYDEVKASGLFQDILNSIPESEIHEWETVWKMTIDDFEKNEMNPNRFFAKQITRFGKIVGGICEAGLGGLVTAIEKVDPKVAKDMGAKLESVVKKVIKK